ncbi:hypothetical protein FISHEDRAFT_70849 [Fistulina hepatica ATCC 64428]|uniref:Uncharacterized protein n=1 Tax=Fistulina hepatica ATCC 64428 TaxID=1128425 RepID=A0A0D7AIT9_9AGAR|nr:hypothetical protein FISHEDRAFT_70849 [Fistulina hepatica ATCC 64428]
MDIDKLATAAHALHKLLNDAGFEHAFCGGLEVKLLGLYRGTSDVDVEVRKGLIKNFTRLKAALNADHGFWVFDGRRTDGIRAIHKETSVGLDIWIRGGDFYPKKVISLSVEAPNVTQSLPFFDVTEFFCAKFRTAGVRTKPVDSEDCLFIFNTYHEQINVKRCQAVLSKAMVEATLARYPQLTEVAVALGLK